MKRFLLNMLPFSIIAGLLCLLFWQVFFQGYVVVDGDNFHLNMPMKYLLVDAFKNHYFPFWNPYILSGIPYAADLNLGTFNPLNVLYLFFSVPRALTIQIVSELFLIGSFEYIFLRQYFTKTIAVFGGVLLMLCGTIFSFTSNIAVLHAIVYVPLLFYLARQFFIKRKKRYFIFLVLSQVVQIISGHPQITYYTIIFIGFFMLFQTTISLRKRILLILIYGLFSLFIASFQLLPFAQYALLSNRPGNSLSYATSGSFGISQLLTTFLPTFFGAKLYGNWWGSQVTLVGYMGPVALLLLGIGLVKSLFKEKIYYTFAFIMSFLLSLGKWGIVYFLFYYLVPGWKSFRSPADLLVLTTFFACLFVSHGLQILVQNIKQFVVLGKRLFLYSLVVTGASLLVLFMTTHVLTWVQIFSFIHRFPFVAKILFYSPKKIDSMFWGIWVNIFFVFIILTLSGITVWKLGKQKNVLLLSLFTLMVFSLIFFDRTYLQLAPLNFYNSSLPKQLETLQNQQYRLYAQPVVIAQNRQYLPGPSYFYTESQKNLLEITDNHAMQYNLLSITGYTSLVLKNYGELVGGNNITGIDTKYLTKEKLNELSVKYLLTLNSQGNQVITQNNYALPRYRLLDASGKILSLKSLNPNKTTLNIESMRENTLLIANTYFPGWEAIIHGKSVPIVPYMQVFQQIAIPKGESVVTVRYNPFIWEIGLGISLLSLGVFFILAKKYV